jgi:hypothetical protein
MVISIGSFGAWNQRAISLTENLSQVRSLSGFNGKDEMIIKE